MSTNMFALDAALNAAWAMERDALERLLDIAARQNEVTPEALEAYRAKTLAGGERAQIRNGVAIINAVGPMFKRANLMTAVSGATSYDVMRRDLQAAVDGGVKAAIINTDTPGGEASGTAELADFVYSLRDKMRIVAYVGGMGASAGYWLASAAHEVVIDSTALLGSIGVQWAMTDTSAAEEKRGVKRFTFISSQSPMKNADPGSAEGASHLQAAVDAQAQVFIENVARNRGVAIETVLTDFGKGGIFVGQQAVDAGLADSIGSFEAVLADLSATGRKSKARKGATMSDEISGADHTAAIAAAVTTALTAERERVAGLNSIAAVAGATAAELSAAVLGNATVAAFAVAQAAASETRKAAAAAETLKAEAAEAEKKGTGLKALETDEEQAGKAKASTGKESDPDSAEAVAARIAAA